MQIDKTQNLIVKFKPTKKRNVDKKFKKMKY